ncbi:MAG: methyltransferase MtaB domain-containing protein [Conexivisphaerales archaeon]
MFKELAYQASDELIFSPSKHPLRYGYNLSIGDGKVVPELKYIIKEGLERDRNLLIEEYSKITSSSIERAVELGLYNVQLEMEISEPMTIDPDLCTEIVAAQKGILQEYYERYGINAALLNKSIKEVNLTRYNSS